MSKLGNFLDRLGELMIRGSQTRYGMLIPLLFNRPVKKPVGVLFIFDELWPGSSEAARSELLWMTPYPFVDADTVAKALREMRTRWGPNIGDAIQGEMDEFDRIWEETRAQREAWENEGGNAK